MGWSVLRNRRESEVNNMASRFRTKYETEIKESLKKELGITNVMAQAMTKDMDEVRSLIVYDASWVADGVGSVEVECFSVGGDGGGSVDPFGAADRVVGHAPERLRPVGRVLGCSLAEPGDPTVYSCGELEQCRRIRGVTRDPRCEWGYQWLLGCGVGVVFEAVVERANRIIR